MPTDRPVLVGAAATLALVSVFAGFMLVARLGRSLAQLPTPRGREVATRSVGLAAQLRSDPTIAELPPAGVKLWDRVFAYAAAFGAAPRAVGAPPDGCRGRPPCLEPQRRRLASRTRPLPACPPARVGEASRARGRARALLGSRRRRRVVRLPRPRGVRPPDCREPVRLGVGRTGWAHRHGPVRPDRRLGALGAGARRPRPVADANRHGRDRAEPPLPAMVLVGRRAQVLVLRGRRRRHDAIASEAWRLSEVLYRDHAQGEQVTAEVTQRLGYVRSLHRS